MDNAQLINILKNQKIPLELAVANKISYLKGDQVFQPEGQEYLDFSLRPKFERAENKPFQDAFQSSVQPRPYAPGPAQNYGAPSQGLSFGTASQEEAPQQVRPMSVAQRIAALRGAVGISSGCAQYQRKH